MRHNGNCYSFREYRECIFSQEEAMIPPYQPTQTKYTFSLPRGLHMRNFSGIVSHRYPHMVRVFQTPAYSSCFHLTFSPLVLCSLSCFHTGERKCTGIPP